MFIGSGGYVACEEVAEKACAAEPRPAEPPPEPPSLDDLPI